MIIHHFATIVLMYFSWVLNFVRVGTLVLVVHDAADNWLAVSIIDFISWGHLIKHLYMRFDCTFKVHR